MNEIAILAASAAIIGFGHTIAGPDHYLPFIVLARARKWTLMKTFFVTLICGIGHVLSSILIGFAGIALGITVAKLESLESMRGGLAGWALITFGLVYFIWGVRSAVRSRPHSHMHIHADGIVHRHDHMHQGKHIHPHREAGGSLTPWILFTIFVFGPCEPLIPLLMYPAAMNSIDGVLVVSLIFGSVTVLTMSAIVLVSSFGVSFLRLGKLERYSHSMAGATICLSGLAIKFLGL